MVLGFYNGAMHGGTAAVNQKDLSHPELGHDIPAQQHFHQVQPCGRILQERCFTQHDVEQPPPSSFPGLFQLLPVWLYFICGAL